MKKIIVVALSLCSLSALAAPEGTLSVHILNQQAGLPSSGVKVVLDKQEGDSWKHIADVNAMIFDRYGGADDFLDSQEINNVYRGRAAPRN